MVDSSNVTPIWRDDKHADRVGQPGAAALVAQLTDDAKNVASAEIALYKAKAGEALGRYKAAVVFFAIAGVLALCGFIALLVGLIETIATLVGPGFATLIVVGLTFAVAAVLGIIGKNRLTPAGDA